MGKWSKCGKSGRKKLTSGSISKLKRQAGRVVMIFRVSLMTCRRGLCKKMSKNILSPKI
jgi:calcineurin-like phosphoesterase